MHLLLQVVAVVAVVTITTRAIWTYARHDDTRGSRAWARLELIGTLNFVTFWVVAAVIGGAAPLGRVVGDHYFVASQRTYTEVSWPIYMYSWIHAGSQLITFPLAVVGAIVRIRQHQESPSSFRGRGAV